MKKKFGLYRFHIDGLNLKIYSGDINVMSVARNHMLKVVGLTGSGKTIVVLLLAAGINIVGLSEVYDIYHHMGFICK